MGEPIAGQRWTKAQKLILRDSRLLTTRNLVAALREQKPGLQAFVSASAVGYYGDCGDRLLSENEPAAEDFLGTLCREWEQEAREAPGQRAVQIRVGVVLANAGGALAKMVPIFERGLGGHLGNGRQWMSWIHIDDLVRVFVAALENSQMRGPFNTVAPAPVTNQEFSAALARQIKVRAMFPVPKVVLHLALGGVAQVLLASQRVKPDALEEQNFKFRFPSVEEAFKDLYGRKASRRDR